MKKRKSMYAKVNALLKKNSNNIRPNYFKNMYANCLIECVST